METATAQLNNFRQSPRKMRLIANLVRGKKVSDALVHLEFTGKRASAPIRALIASAAANAKAQNIDTDSLVVAKITVNAGKTLYRRQPASRGAAHPIRKRTSKIVVEVAAAQAVPKRAKIKKE